MSKNVSAVILAAGLGTRMKSKLAKVLHRAGGLSLIEHVVRAACAVTTAERVVAVIGHQSERVRATVEGTGIGFRLQTEQKGTGHAVLMCDDVDAFHEGRMLILYGDCPLLSGRTLERLIAHHETSGAAATVITTNLPDPTGYGRIVRDAQGLIAAIVEQKAATEEQKKLTEINSGIYCVETAEFWELLRGIQPNPASGEIYLTDVVEALNAAGRKVSPFVLEDPSELLGINTKVELAEVDRIFRQRKTRELMLAGVTIEQPETVVIDADVTVGADSTIGPFTQLLGLTQIGEDCEVGACSIVRNSTLGRGARVLAYSMVEDSLLAPTAQVGPYSRLRMQSELAENTRVGNFVELKKAKLAEGAKANHLAYLGDVTIGAKSNIGAGTITCNYDGVNKHKTTIGEGTFIGSNSTLVAPVDVESGAYVAAGSVITEAVPEDALALGRARQVVKPGWAKTKRATLKKQ